MRTLGILPLALITIVSLGCNISNDMKWSKFRENVFNEARHKEFDKSIDPDTIPHRMAVIWHDATASQPGATATRGFGGRIYFYNQYDKPITVDGELVVYGYDDTGTDDRKSSPDKKFVFEAHELQRHEGESDLGTSYSVWIPWDKVGGYRKNIGLVAVFKGKRGEIVKGYHSVNVLPGKKREEEDEFDSYTKRAKGLHLTYTGIDAPANRRLNNADIGVDSTSQISYRNAKIPTTIPIPRETQRRIEAMRKDMPLSEEMMRQLQLEQARQMAEQPEFGGELETKVVYGKQDPKKLLAQNNLQNQSFTPPQSMINGSFGAGGNLNSTGNQGVMANQGMPANQGILGNQAASQNQPVQQSQYTNQSQWSSPGEPGFGNQSFGNVQQTSGVLPEGNNMQMSNSTQSDARQPEARRAFGRPGSYR